MKAIDVVLISLKNVKHGKSKSFLCVLALAIGICSVCSILSFGNLAAGAIETEIDAIGVGGLTFFPEDQETVLLSEALLEALQDIDGVAHITPLSIQTGHALFNGQTFFSALCGVDAGLKDVFALNLLHGRLLQSSDISGNKQVVIIDDQMAMQVYKRTNVIGKDLKLTFGNTMEVFEIVGVVASQKAGIEQMIGSDIPSFIYLPYTTMNGLLGSSSIDTLAVSCMADASEEVVAQAVSEQLSKITDVSFSYENISQYTESFKSIAQIVSLLVAGVAAISIIVGGIGVMNSMVSSVETRVSEIGIYMAIGAKKKDILGCFLYESLILCLIGGVCGASVSVLFFWLVSGFLGISVSFPFVYLLYGIGIALFCGILFGILPAMKAIRLTPIEAIRRE